MAELRKVQRCYHCGVVLQTEDAKKEGYIRKEILNAYPEGLLLCDNCYNTQRFNSVPKEANFDEQYLSILQEIKDKKPLVVYVIDLFSFEGSFISKITEMLSDTDVLVVANKRDLLPKEAKDEKIKEYVAHRLRVSKLQVRDVILTSTNPGYNIDLLVDKILELRHGRDVYVVGPSLSGKSALITEVLKIYDNPTSSLITTCNFEGTELRGFKIPLDRKTYIYETPGTSNDNSILSKVEKPVQNLIIPKKTIVERKFRIGKEQILLFGGLAGIKLESDKKCNIKVYVSNKVQLVLTRYKGDKAFNELLSKKKLNPISQNFKSAADFDVYDFQITEEGDRDIGILGLGWINFKGENQVFRISVPKGVFVYTTRAKI